MSKYLKSSKQADNPVGCRASMEFRDDQGDNVCTFYCQGGVAHGGPHYEEGVLYGKGYRVQWYDVVQLHMTDQAEVAMSAQEGGLNNVA